MNTQINLLPDSKQQRLRQHRIRQLSMSISLVILAVAIGVPLILVAIKGSQHLYLNRVQSQIDARQLTLSDTPDINTILSVKDHLNALPALYSQRKFVTRLLAYLPKVTPIGLTFNSVDIDTSANSIAITGTSPTYARVDKFFHAIQDAGVNVNANKVEPDPDTTGHFTSVVLVNVSGTAGGEVNFTINATFSSQLTDGSG